MDLKLNDDQNMLKKVAADFIKAEAPSYVITDWYQKKQAFIPELYKKTADVGWLGMMVPDEFGGGGTSHMDCGVVFEELGRAPLPGPYFSCGVLAAQLILDAGSAQQKKDWLPQICDGSAIVIPAISDDQIQFGPRSVQTRAVTTGDGYKLSGTKRFVQDGAAASHFIVAARDEAGQLVLALVGRSTPGVTVTIVDGFMIGAAEVKLEGVSIGRQDMLNAGGGWSTVESVLGKVLPILCAYKVGACQEIFEMTNEYTRTRVVFGQPIGRFQRVQDHCVDISIHLDGARWITYETLWKLYSGMEAKASVHQAKAVASEGYYQSCNFSHMVFAGAGTDYKHPLMAHSVLAHSLYQYLGTPLYHKRAMIDALYPRQIRKAG
ncbi:MAG TPA: acyl-CoA dehydrogenase family protein [Candidatus Binatia bacterium]|nr:acyl-CoA dehydrogenase family protein [Candidatus Binatia bacterium]